MLTAKEAALAVDRSVDTIRRWIRDGRLRARRDGVSRSYFIAEAELLRFCKRHDVALTNPFLERVAS